MRLRGWFSRLHAAEGGQAAERRGGRKACRRWIRSLFLFASEDLPDRAAASLSRHLARCAGCQEELAWIRRLREECRRAGSLQASDGCRPSLWQAVRTAIGEGCARADKVTAPALPAMGWTPPHRLHLRPTHAAALAAAVLLATWLLLPGGMERSGLETAAALEARWTADWNEFVSGLEGRRELTTDPVRAVIPNPDSIDF